MHTQSARLGKRSRLWCWGDAPAWKTQRVGIARSLGQSRCVVSTSLYPYYLTHGAPRLRAGGSSHAGFSPKQRSLPDGGSFPHWTPPDRCSQGLKSCMRNALPCWRFQRFSTPVRRPSPPLRDQAWKDANSGRVGVEVACRGSIPKLAMCRAQSLARCVYHWHPASIIRTNSITCDSR